MFTFYDPTFFLVEYPFPLGNISQNGFTCYLQFFLMGNPNISYYAARTNHLFWMAEE